MNDMAPRGELYLRPRLEAALARAGNTHTYDDILALLHTGRAQLWMSEDQRGALVTELLTYPRLKSVNYWLAAGDLHSCMSMVPRIEAWAVKNGAKYGIGMGRPGFSRVLGPDVEVAGVAYRKVLVP